MTFGEAIRSGLSNALRFGGRASRSEFWWFTLFLGLTWFAGALVEEGLYETSKTARSPVTDVFKALAVWPALAAGFRRLQDTGVNGWVMLLPAVILFASVLLGWSLFQSLWVARGATVDTAAFWLSALRFLAWLAGPAYLATLILLSLFLARPSEPGPNRYGPMPA